MKNRLLISVVVLPLLLTLAACAGSSLTQGFTSQPSAQIAREASPSDPSTGGSDVMVPGLEGIPPDQLFGHFMSAQFVMTDSNGNQFTIKVTPGMVASVDTTASPPTVTVTPNGQQMAQTFNVTSSTVVRGIPKNGSLMAISQGDMILVATRDNSMDAILMAGWAPGARFHPMGWMMP